MSYKKIAGESALKKRLLNGFVWSIGGAVISKAFTLIASIIVSRTIGVTGFGELGILNSTVNMLGEMAGLGIGISITKFLAEFKQSNVERASRILSLNVLISLSSSLILATLLFLFANELAVYLFKNTQLAPLLEIAAVTLFFSALSGGQLGALTGFEAFRHIAKLNFFVGLLSLVLQFALVTYWGIKGVVIALLIVQIINWLSGFIFLKRHMRVHGIHFRFDKLSLEVKKVVTFNVPALLASVMVMPVNWWANMMLIEQESGYAQLGIFNAANQWKMALLFIPSALGNVILPILSSLVGSNEQKSYKKVFYYNIVVNFVVSLLLIAGVSLVAPYIMKSYGKDFDGNDIVLRVLIIVAGLMAINNVIGHAIASLNRMWVGVIFNLFWAGAMILSAYWLCPLYGALGLAYANLIAYSLHTVWQFLYVKFSIDKVFV